MSCCLLVTPRKFSQGAWTLLCSPLLVPRTQGQSWLFDLTPPSAVASVEVWLLVKEQRRWRTLDLESELDITASALLVNVRVLLAGKTTLLFRDGSSITAIFYWSLWTINPLFSGIQWWMQMWVSPASLRNPSEEDIGHCLTWCWVPCELPPSDAKSWSILWWWDMNCDHPCV